MALWYGFNPPFLTRRSVLQPQQDTRLIKNDLIQLLLTNFGERVMRPEIGSPIPGLQFETITDADIFSVRDSIINAVNTYEPRVTVVDVKIKNKQDDNMMIINFYGIVNLDPRDEFNIEIGVSGDKGVAFLRAN